MDVPRHRPPLPGPLCNTAYLFPPAPYVRLPAMSGRKALMQPRDDVRWRCPPDMMLHPMDLPQRKVSRRAKAKVQFRDRVSIVHARLTGFDWTGWEQSHRDDAGNRSPSEGGDAFWCSLRDGMAIELEAPVTPSLPEIVPLPPMFG